MAERLQLIDYFDSLTNEVDLTAETLFPKIPEQYHEYINVKRQTFIDEIEQVKAYNLSNLSDESDKPDFMFKKYCFFLNMEKLNGHRYLPNKPEN